jgi:hypothetical protein
MKPSCLSFPRSVVYQISIQGNERSIILCISFSSKDPPLIDKLVEEINGELMAK